jgi:predicted Co/Zn/Cd cation transporter (cation efflux family)
MNESEWNELQRLWKSSPLKAEPVVAELERLRRHRRWLVAGIAIETIIAIAGFGVGAVLIAQGGTFFVVYGIVTCLYVVAVCALSLWVWRLPQARPEDAVEHAVAVARQHARVGVRRATAMIYALIVAMVFVSATALARGFLSDTASLAGYVVIGVAQLVLAAWFAFAFGYYRARSSALARLEAIAAELER